MRNCVTIIAGLILAGCAPQVPDSRTSDDAAAISSDRQSSLNQPLKPGEIEFCDARDYRALIGSPVAATTFPSGPELRVYDINDIVTNDYIPQRTNVVHEKGRITQVFCG